MLGNLKQLLTVTPGSVLWRISDVNQDSIRVLPRKIDHLFETAEDIFACVGPTKSPDRVHEVDNGGSVLRQVNAHHPLTAVGVISVADERNSNLHRNIFSTLTASQCMII
jgi:hypothetical protein